MYYRTGTYTNTHTNANTQSCIPPHLFWHAWCWQSRNNFLCLYRHCWLAPRGECRRCWQWGRGGGSDGGSSKWHAHLSCEGDWEEHAGKLWPSPLSPSAEPVAILPCQQKNSILPCRQKNSMANWRMWFTHVTDSRTEKWAVWDSLLQKEQRNNAEKKKKNVTLLYEWHDLSKGSPVC